MLARNLSALTLIVPGIVIGTLLGSTKAEGEHPCGSILNETSGVLQYKPFETAKANERCVWVLRVPDASSYNITPYNLGYGGTFDDNALLIIGLRRGIKYTRKIIPTAVDQTFVVEGSVAILTYYSARYRGIGRGFSLFWSAQTQTSEQDNNFIEVSSDSATEIVSSTAVNISHPSGTSGLSEYDNNEISTFIFTPEFRNNVTLYKNEIRFVRLGLEGWTCNDYIDIFTFNPSYAHEGWDTFGRFCGPDSDVTFSANDVILLVFHSNSNGTSSGFELRYRRVEINSKQNI